MQDPASNPTIPYPEDVEMEDRFEDAVEDIHQRSTAVAVDTHETDSSPFVNNVDSQSQTSNQENVSPSKDKRRSRIMTGTDISPLKMLQRSNTEGSIPESDDKLAPPATPKSPLRKSISPLRRFPIKVNSMDATPRSRPQSIPPPARERHLSNPEQPNAHGEEMSLDEAIAQNPGVKHAIEIFEDSISSLDDDDDDLMDSGNDEEANTLKGSADAHTPPSDAGNPDEHAADESMMSSFSNFSVIPNMTTFARLGGRTPTQIARGDPRRDSQSSNLLDFTDNLRFPAGGRTSPTKATPVGDAKKTPQRQNNINNLLDFDIPPMPTPRSVPSITARELESLKSTFMSEISSLKATLSGKQAEVTSFKTALMEAEKRAGDAMEQLREERTMREQFSEEKDLWEKRGREMETVLRQVKEEILVNQRERDEFEAKLEESEGRREAAEMMAQEAESRMATMRAREASAEASGVVSPGGVKSPRDKTSQREIEIAVEKVARELHAAYKQKHEAKVAALKKTYETRWDKKIKELESRMEQLVRENEELKGGRDATMTRIDLERNTLEEERRQQSVKDSAQIKELTAEVEKLEAVVRTVQHDNADLRQQLEGERVEKGELVTLAEELMQMQAQQSTAAQNQNSQQQQQQQHHEQHHEVQPAPRAPSATPRRVPQRASAPVPARTSTNGGLGLARPAATSSMNSPKKATSPTPSGLPPSGLPAGKSAFRSSMIGRPGGAPSGLKPPGASASRIGGVAAAHGRTQSNATGIARPGSGLARPGSGLMSSIQQMGSYRGRGE
ncbi:hypothetical protein VPNG_05466 [Cytospora leucostoma]|uniref:Kinetoplast-associated protein KAP n=1 Tax=Cytospora leucostoma TaxID=1230097 RepID=A0A423XBG5_9PEZI|nr:hypothetical protein VPNG_05466 [Cytospora leucostoma]